ncbi:thiolase family protein [Nocardioides sp. zg-ZUI104]|uniref:thiolase family protein n=1 Tax=Nocardioides faecalis TaxID=2803858 RepID=UPI001BCC8022|nr:thiolase family protein [Nocardioides faecalis]MBS4754541.1 thiolase family protein [Nocardioides faecalis]
MRDVVIKGAGMTRFGKHMDRSMKDLAAEAATKALADAGVAKEEIQAIFFSNALAGLITGQEGIRGEVCAFPMGFGTIPMHNLENACASGGDALHLAWMSVASGVHDTVLVIGAEKLNLEDRERMFSAYKGGVDQDDMFTTAEGAGVDRTPMVDRQARLAQGVLDSRGLTVRDFATIAARAHNNGAKNPLAHRQYGATVETVLESRVVVDPITVFMMSPISDGAAAVVVTRADRKDSRSVRIAGSRTATRSPLSNPDGPSAAENSTKAVYEAAGIGPEELSLAEIHDASVAYEFMAWRDCGLCPEGDELKWVQTGHTEIGGGLPINTSGGLIARGHPIGASALGQICELVDQLRGEAGQRQVADARVALAQVGGGVIGFQTAASCAHILVRD